MAESLSRRIEESFPLAPEHGTREFDQGQKFLEAIRSNQAGVAVSQRRAAVFLTIMVAIFGLITAEVWRGFRFAGIELESISLVHQVLPILVAYGLFEMVVLLTRQNELARAHSVIMSRMYPSIEKNDLEDLLNPSSLSFAGRSNYMSREKMARSTKIMVFGGLASTAVTITAPIALEIYAFTRLFAQYGGIGILYVSLGITILLTILAALVFISYSVEAMND